MLPETKTRAAELIEVAVANTRHAAAVLRNAALQCDGQKKARDLWTRARQLESVVAPLQPAGEGEGELAVQRRSRG